MVVEHSDGQGRGEDAAQLIPTPKNKSARR